MKKRKNKNCRHHYLISVVCMVIILLGSLAYFFSNEGVENAGEAIFYKPTMKITPVPRLDTSKLFCNNCLSKGANYFCSPEKNKCCRHITDPGTYNLSDCDIIHGYDNYFSKLNSVKAVDAEDNYFYFNIYSYKEGKGYLPFIESRVLNSFSPQYGGTILLSFNFNIGFVKYSNKVLTIRKYASCNEAKTAFLTGNYSNPFIQVKDCIFEESPDYEKYFYKNTFIGVTPKGYLPIAQCAAKRVEVDMNKIYNLTGVKYPFPHVIAQYLQGSGGGASGNLIMAPTDFTNPVEVESMGKCDVPEGFFPHESVHLVMDPGNKIDFSYCGMPREGLAQFIEKKIRFDQGDFDAMFDPPKYPKDINKVLGCGETGYVRGYIINGTQTYLKSYTNFTLKNLTSCAFQYNWTLQYEEGQCFWYLIYNKYGPDKFKSVMQEIDKKRFIQDLNNPGQTYDLYKDVLVPVLGPSIVNYTKEKWGIPLN